MTWIELAKWQGAHPAPSSQELYCLISPENAIDQPEDGPELRFESSHPTVFIHLHQQPDQTLEVRVPGDPAHPALRLAFNSMDRDCRTLLWAAPCFTAGNNAVVVAHDLDASGAFSLMGAVRSFFETCDKAETGRIRVILTGQWNHFALRPKWGAVSPVSPQCLFFREGVDTEAIARKLRHAQINSTKHIDVLAQVIAHETGGAEWLCDLLVRALTPHPSAESTPPISDTLSCFHESHDVVDVVRRRILRLDNDQRGWLRLLLDRRVLKLPLNTHAAALDLWLQGLARFRHFPGAGEQTLWLKPPAPIIERCLRALDPFKLDAGCPLALPAPAVNAAVGDVIFRIETGYRDLVVATLVAGAGERWLEKLHGVKTNQKPHRLGQVGLASSPVDSEAGESESERKLNVTEVIQAGQAKLMEVPAKRSRGPHHLSQLTLSELFLITDNNKLFSDFFKPLLGDHHEHQVWQKAVREIRNAVAHHQALKFEVIDEVMMLERNLLDQVALLPAA